MGNFLLGLVVALAIAAGVYYYLFIYVQKQVPQDERGASLNVELNRIPAGAVMEDGTID